MRSYILDVERRWNALGRIDRPGGRTLLDLVKAHPVEFENLSEATKQAAEGARLEKYGAKTGRKLLPAISRSPQRTARLGERPCHQCSDVCVPNRQRCPFHLHYQRTKSRNWYQANRARRA